MSAFLEVLRAVGHKAWDAAFDQIAVSEEEMLRQTFSQVEAIASREMLKLGLQLLRMRLAIDPRANPDGEYFCTRCGGKLRIQQPAQARTLATVIGDVEYQRPYGVCDRCEISYAPLDCGMGIPTTGGSIMRTARICHAAVTARSFEAASDILKEHDGIELSAKQARIIAEGEGGKMVEDRAREVTAFRKGQLTIPEGVKADLLVVTADGGRIQTRLVEDGSSWKEDKVGGVYDAEPCKDPDAAAAEDYDGAKAKVKTYAASMAPWDEFGWMLCLEAWRRGYPHAREKVFISDGASALKTLRQMHFSDAAFILDWYHAAEHLADCAKAAFGEGSEECVNWYKWLKKKLWQGEVDAIVKAIEKESLRVGKPGPNEAECSPRVVLHRNMGYFENNREGLDYPRFRAEGWPIGSGIAEGAVKQFGMRMKGTEKFWNGFECGQGAEEMLALCAMQRSQDERWRVYWDRRSMPYKREPKGKDTGS